MKTVATALTFGLPGKVIITDMVTPPQAPIVIVVGHHTTDVQEHLGKHATLLIEGQPFRFVRFTRVFSAVLPSKAKRAWWDRVREQADDRRIHLLI